MDFVAASAELRSLRRIEALQESFTMRLRVDEQQVIVGPPQPFVIADCQIVHRRILNCEVALAHRALDVNYRVTGSAAQSVLRFGSVDLFFDWTIEPAVEENGMIVTACAPFRRLSADRVLHVLDRFSVPLIVERSKVMH